MSFIGFFVYFFLPLPAILLVVLMMPLPSSIGRAVISLSDSILFFHPHPSVPLSFFWACFGFSVLTFLGQFRAYHERHAVYNSVKLNGGYTDDALIKLLGVERNLWIAGSAMCLWVILHRFRHVQKKLSLLELRVKSEEDKKMK